MLKRLTSSLASWTTSYVFRLPVTFQPQVSIVDYVDVIPNIVRHIDDILHARIQTMGVAEHIFDVSLHGRTVTWHLFDVGGARGQRHTWVPYFDDA